MSGAITLCSPLRHYDVDRDSLTFLLLQGHLLSPAEDQFPSVNVATLYCSFTACDRTTYIVRSWLLGRWYMTHAVCLIKFVFSDTYVPQGFCGLGVACWPLVPKFAGSNPAEAVGFLARKKSSARLPSERK